MKLIVMRHAKCEGLDKSIINGWRDYPLTEDGKDEVVEAAKELEGLFENIKINEVYCSWLSRTYDTANILTKSLGMEIDIKRDIRLNERHYGAFQGMTRQESRTYKEYNTLSDSWDRLDNKLIPMDDESYKTQIEEYKEKLKIGGKELKLLIPRAESVLDVEKRVKEFLNSEILKEENNDKTIIVVSHANPVKLIVKQIENLSYEDTVKLRFATCGMKIYDIEFFESSYLVLNEYNLNKEWKC